MTVVSSPAGRRVLQVFEPTDAAWNRLFEALPVEQQDAFYSAAYAQACARHMYPGAQVRCAVWESDGSVLLYPFVQRDIGSLLPSAAFANDWRDLVGLYGRGGIVGHVADPRILEEFHTALTDYCRQQRIICGFDRYHPVLQNQRWASPHTRIHETGGFVIVTLTQPLEELERRFKHALRKNLKKAERAEVEVIAEHGTEHLDHFLTIYNSTLERRQARPFYYLDRSFYEELVARLGQRCQFFYATLRGAFVSCELVLYHGRYCHSFLGGTLESSLDACPNHLLKREMIRDAKHRGYHYYLLGGGSRPYDGTWRYKQGFAVNGSVPSLVGTTLFDEAAYSALRRNLHEAGVSMNDQHFQFYDPS